MAKFAKLIDSQDNVATAVADAEAGDTLTVQGKETTTELQCNQPIPFGHKIALQDIEKGQDVVKYGQRIGKASAKISRGDWVHTHNVKDDYQVLDQAGQPLPGQEG